MTTSINRFLTKLCKLRETFLDLGMVNYIRVFFLDFKLRSVLEVLILISKMSVIVIHTDYCPLNIINNSPFLVYSVFPFSPFKNYSLTVVGSSTKSWNWRQVQHFINSSSNFQWTFSVQRTLVDIVAFRKISSEHHRWSHFKTTTNNKHRNI